MRTMRAALRLNSWAMAAGMGQAEGLLGKGSGNGHTEEELAAGKTEVLYPLPVTYPQPAPWCTAKGGDGMGCVAVIGNFDGVHAGHVALLSMGQRLALAKSLPLVALTFEPHPRTVLKPAEPLTRLTNLSQKTWLLQAAGAGGVAIVPFDTTVAAWTPAHFMQEILQQWLGADTVVVGENFRFGAQGAGDVALLRQTLGADNVQVLPLVKDAAGAVVSSSAMRMAKG